MREAVWTCVQQHQSNKCERRQPYLKQNYTRVQVGHTRNCAIHISVRDPGLTECTNSRYMGACHWFAFSMIVRSVVHFLLSSDRRKPTPYGAGLRQMLLDFIHDQFILAQFKKSKVVAMGLPAYL